MEKKEKEKISVKKRIWHVIRNILVVFGVLFIILLLLPEDEEEEESAVQTVAEEKSGDPYQETMDRAQQLLSSVGSEPSTAADRAAAAVQELVRQKRAQQGTESGREEHAGGQSATVLIYMNGSDLESDNGSATEDIREMLQASYSDQVNVLIETIGTRRWSSRYRIASDRTQRYRVLEDELELVDDSLGQQACTEAESLADFIEWGASEYPAERYMLILWGHGAGPVYGFGYDEHQDEEESLTMDEMQAALKKGGVYFDFIGMDCCIMSCLELCCAMYDFCDYMILSEDFESGLGWDYTGWLNCLSEDPSIETQALGRVIIDDMVEDNEQDRYGDSSTLALLDESYMKLLYTAWVEFAYANEDALLDANYSTRIERKGRAYDDYSMDDYYVTDIMALAQNVSAQETEALAAALDLAVAYYRCTEDETGLTGLSVTLPYGDAYFYDSLQDIFLSCGLNQDYVKWLGKFVDASGYSDYYDYDEWYEDDWSGWDDYDEYFDWFDWDYDLDDDWYDWDSYDYDWDEGCYGEYDDWE